MLGFVVEYVPIGGCFIVWMEEGHDDNNFVSLKTPADDIKTTSKISLFFIDRSTVLSSVAVNKDV